MILMYHNVGEEVGFNTLPLAQLEQQLEYLKGRVELLSIKDYVDRVMDGGTTDEMATLTFDDGY
ncbi:MAG: hypothetical protein AAGC85_11480, partial [Bacteroidota bacterium]